MGQTKFQSPFSDRIFFSKLLFIALLDPFEIILDNLKNFDNCAILIYVLFDDLMRLEK